jgi:hypothetical protein
MGCVASRQQPLAAAGISEAAEGSSPDNTGLSKCTSDENQDEDCATADSAMMVMRRVRSRDSQRPKACMVAGVLRSKQHETAVHCCSPQAKLVLQQLMSLSSSGALQRVEDASELLFTSIAPGQVDFVRCVEQLVVRCRPATSRLCPPAYRLACISVHDDGMWRCS